MIKNNKQNILYILCLYIFTWFVAIPIMPFFPYSNEIITLLITLIFSWSPTIILFIMFRKLFPNVTVKNFISNAFRERINIKMVLLIAFFQVLIFIGGTFIGSFNKEIEYLSLFNITIQTIIFALIISLITGATGEEAGWRGFLQNSIEKNNSLITTSIIVGIVWAFWHLPAWLFTSGFSGMDILIYGVLFSLVIIPMSIIIGICYNRCKNLFIPMWIHFIFNLPMSIFSENAHAIAFRIFTWFAVLYIILAIGYIIWYKRKIRYENKNV